MYKTDWLEEPIEVITKLDKPIHMNSIKNNDILVLRDQDNVKYLKNVFEIKVFLIS